MLRCNDCGYAIYFSTGYDGRVDRFRCSGASRATCYSASITVPVLEKLVMESLESALFNPQKLYEENFIVQPKVIKIDYNAQLNRLNQSLERAKKAYLEEIDTIDEYKQNKQRLTVEIKSIEDQLKNENLPLLNTFVFIPKLQNALNILKSTEIITVKQAVMRSIVSKIVVNTVAKSVGIYFYA